MYPFTHRLLCPLLSPLAVSPCSLPLLSLSSPAPFPTHPFPPIHPSITEFIIAHADRYKDWEPYKGTIDTIASTLIHHFTPSYHSNSINLTIPLTLTLTHITLTPLT